MADIQLIRDLFHARSIYILTLIIPAVFAVLWFAMTIYVVAFRLREMKPAMQFTGVFVVCAIGSQVIYWLAGKPLCEVSPDPPFTQSGG